MGYMLELQLQLQNEKRSTSTAKNNAQTGSLKTPRIASIDCERSINVKLVCAGELPLSHPKRPPWSRLPAFALGLFVESNPEDGCHK